MATPTLAVEKCPTEEYSLRNRSVVHEKTAPYAKVTIAGRLEECYLTLDSDVKTAPGKLGLSAYQREWLNLRLRDLVQVTPCTIPRQQHLVGTISIEISYHQQPKKPQPAINSDDMSDYFLHQFKDNVFCQGQPFVIGFLGTKSYIRAEVLQITAEQLGHKGSSKKIRFGIIHANTRVIFEKKPESSVQLIGRHVGDSAHQALISPDWDFNQMGIGGLDKEFSDIFRRAFASRVIPPDVVEELGMKHVRGILLFGPPGTGKTLMARQIGKMLHAREPKIINGPEILNKYVGESEANIRLLFAQAEEEQKKMGFSSALHIIIFDEIDAICRTRGSLSGSTGVHDTVVNQLLAKIDGVEQLNNILLIGMTNRKDMIDEALLRPGRLEVQMEIGLPDEEGRLQILDIHTAQLKKNSKLAEDVDLKDLAKRTRNFSGAEIEGLVRSAQSTAIYKELKAKGEGLGVSITHEEARKLKVAMKDFDHALLYDLKPAFGISDEQLDRYVYNGVIPWGCKVQDIIDKGRKAVQVVTSSQRNPLASMLLRGLPGCGKTALAAYIAKSSEFPFVKVISPENMVGFTESAKCAAIKKVFDDAYKSELSCIVVDNIERLLDYVSIGPRFSNLVLQALLVLLSQLPPNRSGKTIHRLVIIGTTGLEDDVLNMTSLKSAFTECVNVPYLTSGDEILAVLQESNMYQFTDNECSALQARLKGKSCCVGVKKLISIIEYALQSENRVEALVDDLVAQARLTK